MNTQYDNLDKKTLLNWGAEHGYAVIVERLLENDGEKVNEKDHLDKTPLHWAAENGHLAVVKILKEQGAKVNMKDTLQETPMRKATNNNHLEIVKYLKKHGYRHRFSRSVGSEDLSREFNWPYPNTIFSPKSLISEHPVSMINSQAESQKEETDQTVNHNLEDNTLILTDLIVRRWTKEKHPFFIGFFSKERVLEERLRPAEKMLEDSLNKFNTNNKR